MLTVATHPAVPCVQVGTAGREEDEEEAWADEVTGVLLALVLLSHKRYLKAPLLPE